MPSLFTQLLPLPASWIPASGADVYKLCQFAFLSTPLIVPVLRFVQAPHGRFSISSSWNVHGNWGWFIMEVVSPITFALSLASQPLTTQPLGPSGVLGLRDLISPSLTRVANLPAANLMLAGAFLTHYLNRAVISPWRSLKRSEMHISVPLSAILFNLINGFLMGSWIGGRSPTLVVPPKALDATKLISAVRKDGGLLSKLGLGGLVSPAAAAATNLTPRLVAAPGLSPYGLPAALQNPIFLLGIAGWAIGFLSNFYHDEILLDLRRPPAKRITRAGREADDGGDSGQDGKPKYGIPKGGLYEYISFPNYVSECKYTKSVPFPSSTMLTLLLGISGFEWLSYALAAVSVTALSPLSPLSATLPLNNAARAILFLTSPPFLFLLAEFCPMFPRALKGHEWYREKFGVEGDGKGGRYPKSRKAIFPGLL